jgi:hypothetical protein
VPLLSGRRRSGPARETVRPARAEGVRQAESQSDDHVVQGRGVPEAGHLAPAHDIAEFAGGILKRHSVFGRQSGTLAAAMPTDRDAKVSNAATAPAARFRLDVVRVLAQWTAKPTTPASRKMPSP